MLEGWLDQVARELLPKDPSAALSLFEAFIEADAASFDRADDSDGVIGDAVRAACRHWLQAAAHCEAPRDVWPERLLKLYHADQYGARDELLRRADLLLDEPAQRGLVAQLESQLPQALEASPAGKSPPMEVFRIAGALSLLSESLRDPDVLVRASLRYSPSPNPVQRQAFARAYLDADSPADARACGHAARYWARLGEIAGGGLGLLPLPSHEDFEAEIRARHGRKAAFWAYVNGARRDRYGEQDPPGRQPTTLKRHGGDSQDANAPDTKAPALRPGSLAARLE